MHIEMGAKPSLEVGKAEQDWFGQLQASVTEVQSAALKPESNGASRFRMSRSSSTLLNGENELQLNNCPSMQGSYHNFSCSATLSQLTDLPHNQTSDVNS